MTNDISKVPDYLADPELSDYAKITLEKRYLMKDEQGNITETPKELFWRVASAVAKVEYEYPGPPEESITPDRWARKFYDEMASLRFLPNSPTLMNAGRPDGQLSACFVLPVPDSIEGIFDAVKHAAMIHKSGGGTGFSFSRIRPKDSIVASTGGIASGPLSFIKIFNTATEQVKQGGARRGANMGILRVDHPDIIEFIRAKEVDGEFSNFNFSVGLTENFMDAVARGASIALVDPYLKKAVREVPAKEIYDLLVDRAWRSGDPGIIFLDRINQDNPTPDQGEIEATNPCGEQPLLPYEACNLGSINLSKFYTPYLDGVDWNKLKKTVRTAVRFLDDVIDASVFPLPEITDNVRKNRKIGLGVMGFADLLYILRIPYNSQKALTLADKIMRFILEEGRQASIRLALEKGPFPAFEKSCYGKNNSQPFRNATITTIAPTGTLSIIADCSSGIEPNFALCFTRNILNGEKFTTFNRYFKTELQARGLAGENLVSEIEQKGTIADIKELPEDLRRVFVTAMDITPLDHLQMQAAFQNYTDNAVSKTVNLPNSATRDDIRKVYDLAWKLGCKGVTVYRDGCKSMQVLATGEGQKKMDGEKPDMKPRKQERPDVINGFTQKIKTGFGTMYLTVNEINGKPFEVFATIGKSGRSIMAKAEAISRLVSLALRSGIPVIDVIRQLKGIGGSHPVLRKKGLVLSIPDAVALILENRYLANEKIDTTPDMGSQKCPECGGELVLQEGCALCQTCGYSKCG